MITIIVPVYNASRYLRKCIDSILSQSFKDFELILINDGSTDESLAICKDYEQLDNRITVISQTNCGVSAARNKGLNIAKGEWITFIDADDYLLDNALSILYERAMQTHSDLVLANALELRKGKSRKLHNLKNEISHNVIKSIKHFALWGYLFNTDIITRYKLRFIEQLAYSEDRIFIYQVARYCKTIAFCNMPVYVYRINETSVCSSPDGVRKACHNIDASFYLYQFSHIYQNDNKSIYSYLNRQSRHLVKLGLYQFIENGFSWTNLFEIKKVYDNRFGNNFKTLLFFYRTALSSYIIYTRREITTYIKQKLRSAN